MAECNSTELYLLFDDSPLDLDGAYCVTCDFCHKEFQIVDVLSPNTVVEKAEVYQ